MNLNKTFQEQINQLPSPPLVVPGLDYFNNGLPQNLDNLLMKFEKPSVRYQPSPRTKPGSYLRFNHGLFK